LPTYAFHSGEDRMAILKIDQAFFKHVRWAALDLQHASSSP
jgi:hypothetical protein